MADLDERYLVVTRNPEGTRAEHFSQLRLEAALYVLDSDRRGMTWQVLVVDDARARLASLAELAADSSLFAADLPRWREAQVEWLRHQLAPRGPEGPDWVGAARRWAAAFRTQIPEEFEEALNLTGPQGIGWTGPLGYLRHKVDELLPLLGHESHWRTPDRDRYMEWSVVEYQRAWRKLDEAVADAPGLEPTAAFFLSRALDRDVRAGRLAGFLRSDHPGVEQWARAAYGGRDAEADRLYAELGPGGVSLSDEERRWADRWKAMPKLRDSPPLRGVLDPAVGRERQDAFWQSMRARAAAEEEQQVAKEAAFAFLAEHHHEITAAARAGQTEGVVAQARRLVRAAFPTAEQARRTVAGRQQLFDRLIDNRDTTRFDRAVARYGQEWMALAAVDDALQALTWSETPGIAATEPDRAQLHRPPAVLRLSTADGRPWATSDPRRALFAWTEWHRPDASQGQHSNVSIEESEFDDRWRRRTPRSLVEQVRATADAWAHWEVDQKLAQWLLADRAEEPDWAEMGARWVSYLGDVPPRAAVLAWVIRLTGAGPEDLARLQAAASAEIELRVMQDTPPARYDAAEERQDAAALAAMDDSEFLERYPWQLGDELGVLPEPQPQARILAVATVEGTRYAHVELARPLRWSVVAHTDDGSGVPHSLGDSRHTDTDVLFEQLTSPVARTRAHFDGVDAAQQAALDRARQAWNTARDADRFYEPRPSHARLEESPQTWERAAEERDEPFLDLQGMPRSEQYSPPPWYEVRVAGDDLATRALADPVETMLEWARRDNRPPQQCVILTAIAGTANVTEILPGELLRQTSGPARERCEEALAAWLGRVRQSVTGIRTAGQDRAAWRRAGWAWALRVGGAVPTGTRDHLDRAAAYEVDRGAQEMAAAVQASARQAEDGDTRASEVKRELRGRWQLLAAALVDIPQARPHARQTLDQLITLDPEAPRPGSGHSDQELRQIAARLWWVSRDLHESDLMNVFASLADPSRELESLQPALLERLPARLHNEPSHAEKLLRAAEQAAGHQALLPLYASYPSDVQARREGAASDAVRFLLLSTMAEAIAGRTAARAREHPEGTTPVTPAPDTGAKNGPRPGLDAAQQEAQQPPPHPNTPPTP